MISSTRKLINDFFNEKPLVYHNLNKNSKYDCNTYILDNITLNINHDNFSFYKKYQSGEVDSALRNRYFKRIADSLEKNLRNHEIDLNVLKNAKSTKIHVWIGYYDLLSQFECEIDVGSKSTVLLRKVYGSFSEVVMKFREFDSTWYVKINHLFYDVLKGNVEMHVEKVATENRQTAIELVKETMGNEFHLDERAANDLVMTMPRRGFVENQILFLKRK